MLFEIMDNDKEQSNALVVTQSDKATGLRVFNLMDEHQLTSAEAFLKRMIATEKGGIKSVNEGLAILMRAQDLNLPFSTCIEHIHVINGKTGVDVHIIKSLLLRAGVVWEKTKDYTPQYQYTDGNTIYDDTLLPDYCIRCRTKEEAEAKTNDKTIGVYPLKWYADLKGNVYNELGLSDKWVIALNKLHAIKLAKEGSYPVIRVQPNPIDYVTEYKFTRYQKVYDRIVERQVVSRFSYKDAIQAELVTKDTYVKYPKVLVGHRAFTLGARDIADDLLMGCMETTELKKVMGVELSPNDYVEVDE